MTNKKEIKLIWVVLANFLNQAGAAFLWPLTTVYIHNYLHHSMATAGVVLFFMSCAMIVGNYLGGWLFDHWKPYNTAVVSVLVATIAIVLLIFFHGWPLFPILLIVIGLGDGANVTVINAYAASIKGVKMRYVFNVLYMALNLGVVVGTLLVGYLIEQGVTLVFEVASVCYIIFLLITVLTFNVPINSRNTSNSSNTASGSSKRSVQLVWLICILVLTAYLSYTLWESVMSVHLTSMGIPFHNYSLLWTLNGFIILLGQPLVNKLEPYLKIDRQIMIGIIIFAASFFLLIFAKSMAFFVVDFVILTIGEMMGLPSIPAWIDQLTDPSEVGKYQGMMNMAISMGRALGPLYGGLVIDAVGYNPLFISVTAFMLISLLLVMMYVRRMRKIRG